MPEVEQAAAAEITAEQAGARGSTSRRHPKSASTRIGLADATLAEHARPGPVRGEEAGPHGFHEEDALGPAAPSTIERASAASRRERLLAEHVLAGLDLQERISTCRDCGVAMWPRGVGVVPGEGPRTRRSGAARDAEPVGERRRAGGRAGGDRRRSRRARSPGQGVGEPDGDGSRCRRSPIGRPWSLRAGPVEPWMTSDPESSTVAGSPRGAGPPPAGLVGRHGDRGERWRHHVGHGDVVATDDADVIGDPDAPSRARR